MITTITIGGKPDLDVVVIPEGFVVLKIDQPHDRRSWRRRLNDLNNRCEPCKTPDLDEITTDSGEIPGLKFVM